MLEQWIKKIKIEYAFSNRDNEKRKKKKERRQRRWGDPGEEKEVRDLEGWWFRED